MVATNIENKHKMSPPSLEGQTLGKYRVMNPLGRGGMARVHKAYHPQLDRYVAIKVLRSDLVDDEEFLARFRREARSVAALRHENIVQVYDFDVHDDYYYMVMELLEGDTLKTYLNACRVQGERLPQGEMVRILVDILSGLEYAHSEGVIHRDIKPANIMLTKHGQAVLTDFGIAQIIGGTQYTISGALMGTLNYMAPEQGLDGHCDVRSDIYSLGIAYYEMLTGRVPFDADTPLAILMKHLNDPLPLPHNLDPNIPELFERVVLKALAKRPEDRYQNAGEMSEALKKAARECGIKIPKNVKLPQVTVTPDAPTGPIPVFSGSARQEIENADFASGETDESLGKTLGLNARNANQLLNHVIKSAQTVVQPPSPLDRVEPQNVGQFTLASVAGLIFINMILLWAGGAFDWQIWSSAWPLEVIGVGILLTAIMSSTANPWIMIPSGIVLGNGLLLSYYAVTGWWTHWAILWPLEPILIGGAIVGAMLLSKNNEKGRWLTRRFGLLMIAAGITLGTVVFFMSLIKALLLPA
ncbi:MAG: protein kinase [Anaerolineales bacterium]|nr:protein kinase [Anaerolineales bacterium]